MGCVPTEGVLFVVDEPFRRYQCVATWPSVLVGLVGLHQTRSMQVFNAFSVHIIHKAPATQQQHGECIHKFSAECMCCQFAPPAQFFCRGVGGSRARRGTGRTTMTLHPETGHQCVMTQAASLPLLESIVDATACAWLDAVAAAVCVGAASAAAASTGAAASAVAASAACCEECPFRLK